MKIVAGAIAEKLNQARGPVKVLIPLGGWSSIDRRGTDFYDAELDRSLRPPKLVEFIGQDRLKENLRVFIEAAKQRGEAFDHILF